ncbi:hypothetical protein HK100_005868 [Physocladia obscura]|uniref:Large ribosomal subunit protein eL22 n=1 Tax=Physocladia obscura TaxID=109957 RepID=A0AAD5ST73_9FUNG|nr:hypothetical protein HK100_005868 [Physocladia obscura]
MKQKDLCFSSTIEFLQKNQKKNAPVKFSVDCSKPAVDGIFDTAAFEKFVHDRFKVDGKANNLSGVAIIRNGNTLTITTAPNTMAKRYLKYLTKKYLKKTSVLDYVRVIATSKSAYEIKYRANNVEEEAEEDEE